MDEDTLLEGLTLTHRLSDGERASGEVVADPDLVTIHVLAPDGRHVPLVDGGQLTCTSAGTFAGPPGWLPDPPVLQLTIRDGAVAVAGADEVPGVDPEVAGRLAATFAAVRDIDAGLEVPELVLEARVRYPRLLAEPQAPMGDLLDAADLRHHGTWVLHRDDPDPEPPEDALLVHLRRGHGFDDRSLTAFLVVHNAALAAANELLRRRADTLEQLLAEAGEELDVDEDSEDARRLWERFAELAAEDARAITEAVDLTGDERDELAWSSAHLLGEQSRTVALLHDGVGSDALTAVTLLALFDAAELELDRHGRANRHWLRARLLEFVADDHTVAEAELRRALDLDRDHGEAVFDLARYRADRGEAGAALGLLRQLEHGGGDPDWVALLERYAAPGPTSAGRNQPCPCGSGRKHKVCCATRNGWPLADRVEWVYDKISRYATSAPAADLVDVVLEAAGVDPDEEGAWSDLALANLTVFDGGVVRDLVERRGALLPADELELLRGWAEVRAGACEVVDVDPGRGVAVRDHRTGQRLDLPDRSLSRELELDDLVLAWIVPGVDGPEAAVGVVRVPHRARRSLLWLLDEDPGAEELAAWYAGLTAPPALANTEGEPLLLTTLTYEVPDGDAAGAALATRLEGTGQGTYLQHVDGPAGQRWVRGTVHVDGRTVTVETDSVERAARLHDLIEELLPDAELVDEQRIPVDDLATSAGDTPTDEPALPDLEDLAPEELAELTADLDRWMSDYEDRWVDLPLPALDGATPRQAAADPARRGDLERLLRSFEPSSAWTSPGRPMDPDRLRRLLGLDPSAP